MAERFQRGLGPAFTHLVEGLAANAPLEGIPGRILLFIAKYVDESYAALSAVIQARSLASNGACRDDLELLLGLTMKSRCRRITRREILPHSTDQRYPPIRTISGTPHAAPTTTDSLVRGFAPRPRFFSQKCDSETGWQVLLPYLKLKLDKFHTRVREGHRSEVTHFSLNERVLASQLSAPSNPAWP